MSEQEERHNERQNIEPDEKKEKRWSCTIIATVIIEIIILAVVCTLEYFLRFTTVFPLRKQNFSCTDPDINFPSTAQRSEYSFNPDVPLVAIYILDFGIPVAVVLFGEIGIWTLANDKQKTSKICRMKFPKVLRRSVRFIGVFLFGMVTLMIYIDVTKLMTGRLAPNFLNECVLNKSLCISQLNYGGDELCTETNQLKLKYARTSFPSIYSAMSIFSGMFVAIYIHGALKTRSVRIFRPFLTSTFLMLALLCGLWEIGTHRCHWTDAVVGYLAGITMAVYLCYVTLKSFEDLEDDDKLLRFFHQLIKEQEEENANIRLHTNRNLQRQKVICHSPKTRWQRAVTTIQETRTKDPALYNTFQRDLSKTIDFYRDRRNTVFDSTQIV